MSSNAKRTLKNKAVVAIQKREQIKENARCRKNG